MKRLQQYRDYLAHLGAPTELLSDFDARVAIHQDLETSDDPKDIVIEVCIQHRFLKPFEADGKARAFRNRINDDRDGVGDTVEEIGYRRGYDQGFQAAIAIWQDSRTLSEAEELAKRIHCWRVRPIQIIGSTPGDDEGETNWFSMP